jgi:co-chaperonin GroES (HSP10)
MEALGNYILIKEVPVEKTERVKGTFQFTDAKISADKWKNAHVVKVGNTVDYDLKEGSLIVFDSIQGHNITISDQVFRLILERDVVLVL